jgi:hypothetical protein
MWLTYMKVNASAEQLDYDLAISPTRNGLPALSDAGIEAPEARFVEADDELAVWPIVLGVAAGIATLAILRFTSRHRDEQGVVPWGSA